MNSVPFQAQLKPNTVDSGLLNESFGYAVVRSVLQDEVAIEYFRLENGLWRRVAYDCSALARSNLERLKEFHSKGLEAVVEPLNKLLPIATFALSNNKNPKARLIRYGILFLNAVMSAKQTSELPVATWSWRTLINRTIKEVAQND